MKPACVKCQVEMKTAQTGAIVITTAYDPPQPYEAYNADVLICPKCGIEIVAGYGNNPFARSGEPAIYAAAQDENAVFGHERAR